MINGKGGQTLFISIVFALFLFIVGMIAVNFIMDSVTFGRSVNGLGCASATTDGQKVACLVVDFVVPYFFVIIISAAGGYILNKVLI